MDYTEKCTVADAAEVEASVTPPKAMAQGVFANGKQQPPQTPPPVSDGVCNDYLPNDSTYNRYVWVVRRATTFSNMTYALLACLQPVHVLLGMCGTGRPVKIRSLKAHTQVCLHRSQDGSEGWIWLTFVCALAA